MTPSEKILIVAYSSLPRDNHWLRTSVFHSRVKDWGYSAKQAHAVLCRMEKAHLIEWQRGRDGKVRRLKLLTYSEQLRRMERGG